MCWFKSDREVIIYASPSLVATLLLRLSSALERRCLGFYGRGWRVSGVACEDGILCFSFFLPRMEVYLVFCILALRSPLRLAPYTWCNQIQVYTSILTMRGGSTIAAAGCASPVLVLAAAASDDNEGPWARRVDARQPPDEEF